MMPLNWARIGNLTVKQLVACRKSSVGVRASQSSCQPSNSPVVAWQANASTRDPIWMSTREKSTCARTEGDRWSRPLQKWARAEVRCRLDNDTFIGVPRSHTNKCLRYQAPGIRRETTRADKGQVRRRDRPCQVHRRWFGLRYRNQPNKTCRTVHKAIGFLCVA